MIRGAGQRIDSTQLLQRYDQEAIFKLAGFNPDLRRKNHKNPLRVDRKGGCWYTWYEGVLYFNDHSPHFPYNSITCIQAIQLQKGFKSYDEACAYIMKKLKPSDGVNEVNQKAKIKIFPIKIKNTSKLWTEENNVYSKYNVSVEDLNLENVQLVKDYWCNTRYVESLTKNPFNDPSKEITVCYNFPSGRKQLYFPQSNDFLRFYNSATQDDLFGYDILHNKVTGDTLWWTKGGKDYLTVRRGLGLPCMGNISENYNMSFSLLRILEGRFKRIVAFGDNDDAGKKALEKKVSDYKMVGALIDVDNCNDISDVVEKLGKEESLCYLKKF